jgi:hypothetical protein
VVDGSRDDTTMGSGADTALKLNNGADTALKLNNSSNI